MGQFLSLFGSAFPVFLPPPLLDYVRLISSSFSLLICSFMPIIFRLISISLGSRASTIFGSFTDSTAKFSMELCFFLLTLLLSSFLAEYCCRLALLLWRIILILFLKSGDSLLSRSSYGFDVTHFFEGRLRGYLSCCFF